MKPSMVIALCLSLAATLLFGAPPSSQRGTALVPRADERLEGRGFAVVADRRIFAVMAFLNAVGFDEEVQGQAMHPTRIKIRQMIDANLKGSEKVKTWRQYYESRRLQ